MKASHHPWPFAGHLPVDAFPRLPPRFCSGQRIQRLQHLQQPQQILCSARGSTSCLYPVQSIALDLPEHLPHLEATLGIPGQWDSQGWTNMNEYHGICSLRSLGSCHAFFLAVTLWVPPALVGKEGLHLVNPAQPRHSPQLMVRNKHHNFKLYMRDRCIMILKYIIMWCGTLSQSIHNDMDTGSVGEHAWLNGG